MKTAIIGHGKMGRLIEEILKQRGHKVVCIIDEENIADLSSPQFASADVAIEFTRPSAALDNVLHCFAAGVPVVSGTTGWTDFFPEVKEMCRMGKGALLWSSNFSVGMNMFMAVNRYLSALMARFPEYHASMSETHHVHKLDHPSGTALTLAADLIEASPVLKEWREPAAGEVIEEVEILPIVARREGEVPGIHTICWESPADEITITHSAKNRRGFAMGAVLAAEWLTKKKIHHGFYSMKDVLGF